jgi:hypothetical protein
MQMNGGSLIQKRTGPLGIVIRVFSWLLKTVSRSGKQRRDGFERKFEATAELEKQKQKKAREKFDKALSHAGSETEEDNDKEK